MQSVKTQTAILLQIILVLASATAFAADQAKPPVISGELKQWHKVTLTLDGPFARETDDDPNPFTDYAFQVKFTHESGSPSYTVPGYFAADETSSEDPSPAKSEN